MKKKLASLALTLALGLSLAVPAFAVEVKSNSVVYQEEGVTIYISDVISCETVRITFVDAHLSGEWYVKDIPVFHVKEGAVISVENKGATLTNYGKPSSDYYSYNPWLYSWMLSKDGDSWTNDYVSEEDIGNRCPDMLPQGQTTAFSKISAFSIPDAAKKQINQLGIRIERDGPYEWSVPDLFDLELWYTVGEASLTGSGTTTPGTTTPGTTTPGTPNFTDVKAGDWFYEAVQWAVKKEITTGTTSTTFSPNETCTEAQILTFLWRAMGSPEPKDSVSSIEYYAKAAQWAKEQGIVDKFDANTPCTRAMTVDYLWATAGRPYSSAKPSFADVQSGTPLEKAVAWAVETGVTTGTSATTFSPNTTCTRGEIVTFLYRDMGK